MKYLSPWTRVRFLDANGDPLSGGKLYTYLTGTSTSKATYSDSGGTLNANPVILDAEGYTDVWLDNDADYRFRLENSAGVLQWQRDDISPTGAASGDSTILGNSGKTYKMVAGVLRQTTAGGGWSLIDDANHKPVNCTGAISVDSDGNLRVEYGFTAVNKSGFVVGVDETFAELGVQVGASVGNSFAILQAYAAFGGAVGVGGVASQTALGQILNIAPYTAGNNQIVDATNGWITVMHDSIAHASGNGPAVSTSIKGNHGFFDVTSTKTSFTLRYKRNCSGVV